MDEKKSLVPVGDSSVPTEEVQPEIVVTDTAAGGEGKKMPDAENAGNEDIDDKVINGDVSEEDAGHKEKDEVEPADKQPRHRGMLMFAIIFIALLLGVLVCWHMRDNVHVGPAYDDAAEVMSERMSPDIKAKHLSPSHVYRLESATDSYHGMSVTVTRIQFRQDVTRLWVHIKNDSGRRISVIPATNSVLTDDKGRTYKAEAFSGDQMTAAAPGSDEEVLLAFEPVRNDAKSLTFTLDGVFDMKNTSWNYAVQFDLP